MKRFSVTVLAAALATGAFATVNSTNTFAQMSVESSEAWTLLALPWVTPGSDGTSQDIVLTNLVLTAGLSEGDLLMHLKSISGKDATYDCWKIESSKWVACSTATGEGFSVADDPETATFPRGTGVWLKRSSTSNPILLYGQVKSDDYGSTTVPAGSTALVACPRADDLVLKNFTSGQDGDEIKYGTAFYRHVTNAWCKASTTKKTFMGAERSVTVWVSADGADDKIPAGLGFFYTNRDTSDYTIEW